MTVRSLLSVLVFAVTLGALTWVSQSTTEPETDAPITTYALHRDQEVVFAVRPDDDVLRIDTMLSVPRTEGSYPNFEADYQLIFRWRDPSGSVVAERRVEERSFVSWIATGTHLQGLYGRLPNNSDWLTDGRLTTVPVRELLPQGGEIVVRAESPHPVLLRAFLTAEVDEAALQYQLYAPPQRRVDQLSDAHDLPDWSTLAWSERRGLLAQLWLQQSAVTSTAPLQRAIVFGERLSPKARTVRRQRLLPGRATAINLIGPAQMLVSGGVDIEQLVLSQVTDVPAGTEQPAARVTPAVPLGLAGAVNGFAIAISEPWPTSVHIRNDGDEAVAFYLSLDEPRTEQLFEHTAAHSLASLLPEEDPLHDRDTALLGPEVHEQLQWLLTPDGEPITFDLSGFQATDPIRVTVRPLAEERETTARATLQLEARTPDEQQQWRMSESIAIEPSRYERVVGSDLWVSEATRLHVVRPAHTLSLTSDSPMLVRVEGRAPPLGSRRQHLVSDQVRLRYERQAPTTWTSIQPTNTQALSDSHQVRRLQVVTRIVLPAASTSATADYGPVKPLGQLARQGGAWLTPERLPGSGYCAYATGETGLLALEETSDRSISAVLWSPASGLGSTWGVLRRGVPWLEGVVRQRVSRRTALLPEGSFSLEVTGPPGGTLWLGTSEGTRSCSRPHASRTYYPVEPGETAVFPVSKGYSDQLVSVNVLGREDTPAAARLRFPGLLDGARAWRSLLDRELTFQPTTTPARALLEPDARRWVQSPFGMVLRDDVPAGTHNMHFTNESSARLLVRVSVEGAAKQPPEARWVRFEEAP